MQQEELKQRRIIQDLNSVCAHERRNRRRRIAPVVVVAAVVPTPTMGDATTTTTTKEETQTTTSRKERHKQNKLISKAEKKAHDEKAAEMARAAQSTKLISKVVEKLPVADPEIGNDDDAQQQRRHW